MRETCICEQPMRRPISAWVRSSRKRRCTDERVAFGQRGEQAVERGGGFGGGEAGVLGSEPLCERGGVVAVVVGEWPVEGVAAAGVGGFGGVEDVFDRAAEPLGELGRGRTAAELARELVALAGDADGALLEVAWWADGPGEVAEVAPDLALDGRHREGAEGRAVVGVKAIQRLDQTQRRDLLQILERHPVAAVKTPRDRIGERKIGSNQAFTGVRVAVLRVGAKIRRLVSTRSLSSGAGVCRRGGSRRGDGHGTEVLPGTGSR